MPSSGTALFSLKLDPEETTFWTGDIASEQSHRGKIATGAQVISWKAGIMGGSMASLAVVGEIMVSQPTPTPASHVHQARRRCLRQSFRHCPFRCSGCWPRRWAQSPCS